MSTSVSSPTPQAQDEGAGAAYTFIARTSEVEPGYALQVQVEGRPPLAVVCLFDIRTGAATAHPCSKALTIYPVKVENDQVFAALDAGHCADGA